MAKSREISIFNLSFLDVLSCGMGSVILLMLIFSTLVREKMINQGQRLLVMVEYEGPAKLIVDKSATFYMMTPQGKEFTFLKPDNRPMVQIFDTRKASSGRWKIISRGFHPTTYSLLIIYGGRVVAELTGLSSGLPGIISVEQEKASLQK